MDALMPIAVFLLFAGIVYAIWYRSPAQVNKRRLASASAVPIEALVPDSIQKVTGVVVPIETLESPMEGAACVYWDVAVLEPHGKSWRIAARRHETAPFWLKEKTGRVYVDLRGVDVHLDREETGSSSMLDSPTERERQALLGLGLNPSGLLGMNRSYRYQEARLDVAERVSVMGRVEIREVDGEAVFVLVPADDGALAVSDAKGVHG